MNIDLKSTWRAAKQHRLYTAINVTGLFFGFIVGALLILYIHAERHFDAHAKDIDTIFRINSRVEVGGTSFKTGTGPAPLADTLVREVAGVEDAARLVKNDRVLVKRDNEVFAEEHFYYSQSSLFHFFDYDFIEGTPQGALDSPDSVVLTVSMAKKFFGSESAVEKTLTIDDSPHRVTAVIADPPENSHFVPTAFLSIASLGEERNQVWASLNDYTFLRLESPELRKQVENRIPLTVEKYTRDIYARFNAQVTFSLQPLADVHLGEKLRYELDSTKIGNAADLLLAAGMALLIVFLASANYSIISMATTLRRAQEIGVRKVLGATKGQLFFQNLFDALVLISLVAVAALVVLWPLLDVFNHTFNSHLSYAALFTPASLFGLLALALIIALIGAGYPSLYVASIDPIRVLKGGRQLAAPGKLPVTSVLLVVQLCLVIAIVASSWLVNDQFQFLKQSDLGFTKENLVKLELSDEQLERVAKPLVEAYRRESSVSGVTTASATPGGTGMGSNSFEYQTEEGSKNLRVVKNFTSDARFAKVMDLNILDGHFFEENRASNRSGIIVNETLVREFGWSAPIGKKMYRVMSQDMDKEEYEVIGVIEDFNIASLYEKLEPVAIIYREANPFVVIRTYESSAASVNSNLAEPWNRLITDTPFSPSLIEDDFAIQYRNESHKTRALSMFTVLAIIIAFIGVFGIASFTIAQSTKELAIRTVLGASKARLIGLLSINFTGALLVAAALGVPLAYSSMSAYLGRFAYHIQIGALPFFVAVVAVLVITALTVGRNIHAAVTRSPIDALKAE